MRLIDADAANVEKIPAYAGNSCYTEDIQKWLNEQPTIEAEPVKRGRWEHNSDFPDRFICYGCGAMFDMWKHEQRLFNYCPNCGADMRGDGNG